MNLDFFLNRPHPEGLAQQIPNLLGSLDILSNPKGIASFSPGLRGTSYPGSKDQENQQPCKGCPTTSTDPFSPHCRGIDDCVGDRRSNPFRVDASSYRTPRVARASQPWAERSHPFRMTAEETCAASLPRL